MHFNDFIHYRLLTIDILLRHAKTADCFERRIYIYIQVLTNFLLNFQYFHDKMSERKVLNVSIRIVFIVFLLIVNSL